MAHHVADDVRHPAAALPTAFALPLVQLPQNEREHLGEVDEVAQGVVPLQGTEQQVEEEHHAVFLVDARKA